MPHATWVTAILTLGDFYLAPPDRKQGGGVEARLFKVC